MIHFRLPGNLNYIAFMLNLSINLLTALKVNLMISLIAQLTFKMNRCVKHALVKSPFIKR